MAVAVARSSVCQIVKSNPKANGLVVIVTNDYCNTPGLSPLNGAPCDGHNLSEAFKNLEFAVHWETNVDYIRLKAIICEISRLKRHQVENYRCIIFIFAGHGTEGDYLFMQKGEKISIFANIVNPLLPKSSKEIGNIPKVYLIDACRGDNYTPTTLVARGSSITPEEKSRGGSLIDTLKVASEGEFLLSFSTMPSYKAFEESTTTGGGGGVWFSSLVEALQMDEYSGLSLDDLLTKTNKLMMSKLQDQRHFQQPEKISRLNDIIFLHPGTIIIYVYLCINWKGYLKAGFIIGF